MARRTKTFIILTGLILVLATAPALAARGGNGGNGGGAVTGAIALHTDGFTARAALGPTYGDTISFDTDVSGKTSPKSTIYVTVVCTQGDAVVYQYSGAPDATYPLADQAGQGLEWDGDDADCSATLIYKVPKGKAYELTWLDVAEFHAYSG
jgi:hypothetical protein